MQEQQGNLEFLSSSSIMVLGLFIVAVTGILCWLAWHRSGYRMQTGWLELLRFVLVCLVVVTLNQPEWLKIQPPDRRSTLAVLWDQSKSMETRDVFFTKNATTDIFHKACLVKIKTSPANARAVLRRFNR